MAVRAGYSQAPAPALPPPTPPPSAPVTMQQAVEQVLAHNPNLLAAQQNLFSMKGQEVEAGLRQNPNLTVDGENISLAADNPSSPYFYSVEVSRLFERGQKRRWRLDVAHSTTDVTRSQYVDQQRQVELSVKTAFTQMLGAKGAFNLAKQNLDDY